MDPGKMDILVDGRPLMDPAGGGVFEYASCLVEALRSRGTGLRIWTNAWSDATATTRLPNKLLHAGIRFLGWPRLDALSGGPPPALFWSPNPHFIALSPQVPLALTVHDLTFDRYPEFFSMKRRLWHKAIAPERLVRRADRLLAVSEHTKRDLIELYGVAPEKIAVTPLGVHPEFFKDAPAPPSFQLLDLPERFILQIGALEPRKNHLATLSAFEMLKTIPRHAGLGLVIAGPPGWNNAPLQKAIARSRWRDDIRLLGFVSREERAALYRKAAALAFPSFYEGFGLPPLEAMASGTPVVASFAASLGEVVDDAGILIDPYRPNELAEALASVLESSDLAAELASRGSERARKFTWEACAEKTAAVFSDLASRA